MCPQTAILDFSLLRFPILRFRILESDLSQIFPRFSPWAQRIGTLLTSQKGRLARRKKQMLQRTLMHLLQDFFRYLLLLLLLLLLVVVGEGTGLLDPHRRNLEPEKRRALPGARGLPPPSYFSRRRAHKVLYPRTNGRIRDSQSSEEDDHVQPAVSEEVVHVQLQLNPPGVSPDRWCPCPPSAASAVTQIALT